jgi:hypothetical protein
MLNLYCCHWVDTSAGGLLVPEGFISLLVSVSALTWFIRYIYHWNLQGLWFYGSQTLLYYLAFQSFDIELTWWMLFQKRAVHTTLYIYVFISGHYTFLEYSSTSTLKINLIKIRSTHLLPIFYRVFMGRRVCRLHVATKTNNR